jgi:hypothetical protein
VLSRPLPPAGTAIGRNTSRIRASPRPKAYPLSVREVRARRVSYVLKLRSTLESATMPNGEPKDEQEPERVAASRKKPSLPKRIGKALAIVLAAAFFLLLIILYSCVP